MHLAFALLLALLLGCETLVAVDDTLDAAVPTHPVTGQPIFNLMDEQAEIARAEQLWKQIQVEALREGIPIDPDAPRHRQSQRLFERLVAVSHRSELPWQLHYVDHPMVNAMTPGGGYVFIFDGLFGGLVSDGDDDALAAVLAHEIAHVALLHTAKGWTWQTAGAQVSVQILEATFR